jgi:sugar phosphate permease
MKTPKFLRDWFTEDDQGQIWSLAHAMGGGGFASFTGMAAWHTVKTGQFDAVAIGTGMAAVLTAAGALIFANSRSGTKGGDNA